MKKILQQALYDMKHQPVIGAVTIIGTALAIFLIMTVVMMNQVSVAPFAPESNRGRILFGKYIHIDNSATHNSSSSYIAEKTARRFYDDLANTEATAFFTFPTKNDISVPGKPVTMRYLRGVDPAFWQVFDYTFVAGNPYSEAENEAATKVAVIAQSIARELFGTTDVVGRTIYISQTPYRVCGVVDDVSPLASESYAEVFVPLPIIAAPMEWRGWFGSVEAAILANSSDDFDAIRSEVQARKQAFNSEIGADGYQLVDHGSPFTIDEVNHIPGSNADCEADDARYRRYIIYAILLLIPAINLSSMTQSRLRGRICEIGVRRAFGSTRSSIISGIIAENFFITLAGGIIGLIFSIIFGYFFSDMIFYDIDVSRSASPALGMLLDWRIFLSALAFCFVLNFLASGIPAWRASRVAPVDAINSRNL